ncbi:MAG: IS66 family transposase zinc-finger binding domain-containing protein, partial [Lachnospiraceae bacterium]
METVMITRDEYEAMKEYKALKEYTAHLEKQVQYLMEQMRLSRHRQYGSSSEKSEYDTSQMNLFNEAELFAVPDAKEPELTKVTAYKRKKQIEGQQRIPDDVPVEVVEHTLPSDEQICPTCEEHLHVMGKEVVRRELKLIPAKAMIVEHVRYTYA